MLDLRDKTTIVFPALNESESIGRLLDEIKSRRYGRKLVVDGHSIDSTAEIALGHDATVLEQRGLGKAGGLLTAFENLGTDVCVVMDGDGSYDPRDLDKFLPLIGKHGLVKGNRVRNRNMSALRRVGNSLITRQFNLLFRTRLGDVCSGMYLMDRTLFGGIRLEGHPMAAEQEIAARAVVSGVRIAEDPIGYRSRSGGRSKTDTWRRGFRDLWTNIDLARTYRHSAPRPRIVLQRRLWSSCAGPRAGVADDHGH